MKILNPKIIYIAAILMTVGIGCRPDEIEPSPDPNCPPGLPCATQTGERTFGCYVDGKPWVAAIAPYVFDPSVRATEVVYDEPGYGVDYVNLLNLSASSIDSLAYSYWSFAIAPLLGPGQIRHEALSSLSIEADLGSHQEGYKFYVLDTLSPYDIKITHLDTEKNIMACSFNMIMITEDKKDTVRISDGRFDVRYNPE